MLYLSGTDTSEADELRESASLPARLTRLSEVSLRVDDSFSFSSVMQQRVRTD